MKLKDGGGMGATSKRLSDFCATFMDKKTDSRPSILHSMCALISK